MAKMLEKILFILCFYNQDLFSNIVAIEQELVVESLFNAGVQLLYLRKELDTLCEQRSCGVSQQNCGHYLAQNRSCGVSQWNYGHYLAQNRSCGVSQRNCGHILVIIRIKHETEWLALKTRAISKVEDREILTNSKITIRTKITYNKNHLSTITPLIYLVDLGWIEPPHLTSPQCDKANRV
jgi:hypothetical protein